VPAEKIVANINADMFLPINPMTVLRVYGLEESGLGDMARRVGEQAGLRVQGDPEPLRNAFVRSDQYSFVRAGIPAVALGVGYEVGTPEHKVVRQWLRERYHAPSDDLKQPIDREAAARFNDVVLHLTQNVANAPQRPTWHAQSFFRRFAEAAGGTQGQ
jgi:Zn-dependent M28 family amino/carboxypeptidase